MFLARLVLAACVFLLISVFASGQTDGQDVAFEDYTDFWARGEYRRALELLDSYIAEQGNVAVPKWKHDRARLRFEVGLVDEAIEDMTELAESRPAPSYSLELALMQRYRGHPLFFQSWVQRAARQMQGRSWQYNRRDQNMAAFLEIAELMGTNPKTVLSAHYKTATRYASKRSPVVQIAAGDIAYRHKGYDIAEDYYLEALEKAPNNQKALAGLIECYWKSHDGRLEPTMERLMGLNPNHPRANAVLVEKYLENADTVNALSLIDDMLAINPVSHRFRSLKSAALFLEDELEAMEQLQEEVLEYNPVLSELYRTTGRIASRQYRFAEGADFQRKALELDPEDYEARALYTLDLMRLGRETEGREELVRSFNADPFNVSLYNLLQLMDTLETFEVVERGAFVLKLPKDEAPIMAKAALDLLDEAVGVFEAKYDIDIEKPVLIEMFDNHDDFMVRSVGLPGSVGHLGICFGKLVTMDAPSVRPKGSSNWRSVLWHEFTHVITLQKTNNRMPRWLSEGISVYEESEYSPAWHNRLSTDYAPILAEEGRPTLSDLDGYFIAPKSGGHLMYGYFAAGEFVQFYADAYGFASLVAALADIGGGADTTAALCEAAGVEQEALESAFHGYLDERLKPYENLPQAPKKDLGTMAKIMNLFSPDTPKDDAEAEPGHGADGPAPTSPFTDAMQTAAQALEAEDYIIAEDALRRVYELFPDYTGEDAPLRRLAQLYKEQGRDEELRGVLEEMLYWTPKELDAAVELTKIYEAEGDWERVASTADWALGIDPYDARIYRMAAEAYVRTGEETRALDALSVLLALDSGKATEYRLKRAQILVGMESWDGARTEVVRLLEEVPHYWEAQELLLQIAEHGDPAANDPTGP